MPSLCFCCGSWCPGPAKITFPKRLCALRADLVEVTPQFSARVEIDPIGLDPQGTGTDLAFVRRGPATSKVGPMAAVARADARHVFGLEIILVQLCLHFSSQLQ